MSEPTPAQTSPDDELERSWENIEKRCAWAEALGTQVILKEGFGKFEEVSENILAYRRKLIADHEAFREAIQQKALKTRLASLKRRLPDGLLRNSSIIQDCEERVIWQEELVKPNLPRRIVSVDDLLESPRPLVTELRWLHLLLFEAMETDLTSVVTMRKGRERSQNDRELEYHPLLLKFMEASAGGQPNVEFLKAREDLSSNILGGKFNEAHEVQPAFSLAVSGKPETGIEKNVAGFSKIYNSNKKPRGPPYHLGIFASRCEYIWFVKFTYEQGGEQVVLCEVAPEFPCGRVWNMSNLLCDLAGLNTIQEHSRLIELCSPEPTPGFDLLVRYVDTLCTMYGVPKAPVELTRRNGSGSIDLTGGVIVGQGYKSLVLKLPNEDCVVKVSDRSRISRESFIHERADGIRFVRPQRKSEHWCGSVLGAGDGLEWMMLAGFGRPVTQADLAWNLQTLWNHAGTGLAGLHARGVLHRDIKPSNMLIFHGDQLWISDFDCSCLVDESLEIRSQRAGAPYFESPLIDHDRGFQYRDDWYSLVLAFLDLEGFYTGEDKNLTLAAAVATEAKFPAELLECVRWLLGDGEGMFTCAALREEAVQVA